MKPMRQFHTESLARRACAHQGATRRLLDARLAQLQAGSPAQPQPRAVALSAAALPAPQRETLADLLAYISGRIALPASAARALPTGTAGAPELKALREHRSTWSRLRLEQHLNGALATVPANAGPLNSQRLLHQALLAMHEASPAYLQRFVMQVEALLWLEQGQPAEAVAKKSQRQAAPVQPLKRTAN